MLKQLLQVWRNNHGPILFVSGFLVAICMSVLWRFNLIPDIGPALRASPTLLGSRSKSLHNIVVVTVTSDDSTSEEVTLQFFSPSEIASETLTPVDTRTERLEGGTAEFLISDLPRGTFAAIAYMDANENMQLDVSEDGTPTEPFAFATTKQANDISVRAKGVFEVGMEPTFLKFDLKQPVASDAAKPSSKNATQATPTVTPSRAP